jgi:hypothetical protein
VWQAALVHGLALTAFMGTLIAVTLRLDPAIWQDDLPESVRARLAPVGPVTRRRKTVAGIVMVCGLSLIFGHLAWSLSPDLVGTAVATYLAFQLFNLFDATIVDLGLVWLQPGWAMVPGTEGAPELRDPRWHLRNYIIGVFAGLPVALGVTGVSALVAWVS